MSIIRNPYLKEAQQQEAISALKAQAAIGHLLEDQTTALNKVPHNIWTSTVSANQIRQTVNRWPEVQTNCIEIKEHEAFKTPVATLLNLWLTRYGNEWIDLEDIEKDEFFAIAYKRLKQMGELEQHYLTDRARYVCRKPE